MSTDHKIQGCISGIDSANIPMGCRSNKAEATLCLCNSTDMCNDEAAQFSKTDPVPMVKLPETKCKSFTEAPYIQKVNKENTCQSDYCFFTQTNVTNYAGESELMTSTSCGQMPQYNFDFLIGSLWPGPGLFANGCYLLQAQGNDTMLGCSCSADNCNAENPYPVQAGNVHCHLAYGATSEDQLNAKGYCKGDYCILQKTVVPGYGTQWLKGCLSANESESASKLKAGYRNILGIEQWLCQSDFCNFDLQSAATASPHLASLNFFEEKPPRGNKNIIQIDDSSREMYEEEEDEMDNFDDKQNVYAVKVDPALQQSQANKRHSANSSQSYRNFDKTLFVIFLILIFYFRN